MAKADLPTQRVQRHGKTGQGPEQCQAVKSTGHDQARRLAQGLALGIGHGPQIAAPFNGVGLPPPQNLHPRGLQLRRHQLPGPDPARPSMPERRCARGQTRCSDLFWAGLGAVFVGEGIGAGHSRGQSAFAGQVVFQNARQGPVCAALQQRLGALQRRRHASACDARKHVVVGRDMRRSQASRQTRCTSAYALCLVDDGDSPAPASQAVRHGRARQTRTDDQCLLGAWQKRRAQLSWLGARSLGRRPRLRQRNVFPSGEPGTGGRADRPGSGGFH